MSSILCDQVKKFRIEHIRTPVTEILNFNKNVRYQNIEQMVHHLLTTFRFHSILLLDRKIQ